MDALFPLLILIASVPLVACIVWLHWRALKDAAIQDVLLFLTGISTLSYIVGRWDRAKLPFLGVIGALLLIAITVVVSSWVGAD